MFAPLCVPQTKPFLTDKIDFGVYFGGAHNFINYEPLDGAADGSGLALVLRDAYRDSTGGPSLP